MKIVILDGYTENPGDLDWQGFYDLGILTVYDRTPADQVISRIKDAEAVIVNKALLTAEIMEQCPNIKYIGVLATGYNTVDIDAANKRGITVCNIPNYGTAAVAQYVFALLLELCHHAGHHNHAVHTGKWSRSTDWCFWDYPLVELKGKTMGIIGFGSIGQATAAIAMAFGMTVVAYDNHHQHNFPAYVKRISLDDLLSQSDVVSLHCPLLPSTQGMINRESLDKMKDGAILINTARGQLVVEEDLCAALRSQKLFGAALDVMSTEPVGEENVLLGLENCIITPHIAWACKESRERLMNIAVENLKQYMNGTPINVVNR